MSYHEIINFWFSELKPEQHFEKSEAVDEKIQEFLPALSAIIQGKTAAWRETPEGALAEIIVLDQFSRNLFRDDARAYAQDELALFLAEQAVAKGFDKRLPKEWRLFMYMPYMHSESKVVHESGLPLFESLGNQEVLKYELIHKDIIDRFGRYPHRNKVLERESNPEEIEYLNSTVESFF